MKPAEFERLWIILAPLLPKEPPKPKGGRPRCSDKHALRGILFILETGIPWEKLPRELNCGSGMTCWRRLRQWQAAGVWDRLQLALLSELNRAKKFKWDRFCIDAGSVPSPRGAKRQGQIPRTEVNPGPRDTSS